MSTNEAEVPQQIWAVIGHADAVSGGAIWATFDTQEKAERYPGPRMMEMMPRIVIEYVPASALAEVLTGIIKDAELLLCTPYREGDCQSCDADCGHHRLVSTATSSETGANFES